MYDSNYVLSILHRQRSLGQSYWVPIFNGKLTAKRLERQERYWPVGMLRDRLMCLIVRVSSFCSSFYKKKQGYKYLGRN